MPQPSAKAEGKDQRPAPGPGQAGKELFQETESPRFELEDELPPEPGQGLDIGEGEEGEKAAPEGQAGLQAFLRKKGMRSAEDLVKSYENLERQSQDKARVAAKIASLPPLPDFNAVAEGIRQRPRRQVPEIKVPDDPLELFKDKSAFENFLGNYQRAVEARTTNEVEIQQELRDAKQLLLETQQIIQESPEDFQRLRPIMAELNGVYPDARPRQLFDMAKRTADEQKQQAIEILRKELGLEGLDLGRIRSLMGRANPAPLTEGGAPPIGTTEGKTPQEIIKNAILASSELR